MNAPDAIMIDDMLEACRLDAEGHYGQFEHLDMAWATAPADISLVPTRFGEVRIRDVRNPDGRIDTPLVLQQDAPNTPAHYDRLLPHLKDFQRIVVVEALGYGFSRPNGTFRFTIEHYADALEDVVDALGLEEIVLHGPCIEGYTALAYAARHPGRVRMLSLAQVPERAEAVRAWLPVVAVPKDDVPFEGQKAFGARRHAYVATAHHTTVAKPENKEPFAVLAREASEHGQCYCNASAMQGVFHVSAAEFGTIDVPALVIWGEGDVTHAKTNKELSPAHLSNVVIERWSGAGHQPELEEPERFAKVLMERMRSL